MEGEQNQEDTNTNSDRIMFTTKKKRQKGKQVVDIDNNETREEMDSDSSEEDA